MTTPTDSSSSPPNPRIQALEKLCQEFNVKYNPVFRIHDGLQFAVQQTGGIGIQVTRDIAKGDVLLVLPQPARITYSTVGVGVVVPTDDRTSTVPLIRIINDISQTCSELVESRDMASTILLLYLLQNPSSYEPVIATWPSPEEFSSIKWTEEELDSLLKGTHCRWVFRTGATSLEKAWQHVRSILRGFKVIHAFGGDQLRERFFYAHEVAHSRCHDGDPDSVSGDILPLIDMFNGAPEGSDAINVGIERSQWAYFKELFGQKQVDPKHDNMKCSLILASKPLSKGDELFLSYGHVSQGGFVYKYGYCPEEFLSNPKSFPTDIVTLVYPPELLPDPNDKARIHALQLLEFPTTLEEIQSDEVRFYFTLTHDELEHYRGPLNGIGGGIPNYAQREPEALKTLRQYLALAVLGDDATVQTLLQTKRLRGEFLLPNIGRVLLQVIDYNLAQLAMNTTNTEELTNLSNNRSKQRSASLYRMLYRDALAQWRHVICRYYHIFAAADDSQAIRDLINITNLSAPTPVVMQRVPTPASLQQQACSVCGSMHSAKRCARCKLLSYCGREHQVKHWKLHKTFCVPAEQ